MKHTTALRESTAAAASGMVGRYSLAIVFDTPEQGSGVWVSHEGSLYIATALHVAELLPTPNEAIVIPRTEAPLKFGEKSDIPGLLRAGKIRATGRRRVEIVDRYLSTDGSDVALLKLRAHPEGMPWIEFYPLDRGKSGADAATPVIVYGYPWDLGVLVDAPTGRGIGFARVVYGEMAAGSTSHANYDPARDILVNYEEQDPTMEAAGMSGAGVWVMPPFRPGEGWDPGQLILVGLQVAWYRKSTGRPLLATRIERVQALLR